MADILSIFITISSIIFFGFFAEFLFAKFKIPDVLLLMLFGFILGPYAIGYAQPDALAVIAPLFTSFALLFLLFDGAFNIDLVSFAKGIGKGLSVSLYNFIISTITISLIALFFGFDILHSMLIGFILGGISSAFVIPIINNLKIKKETYSILALESAITDVLCIVFALTTIEIITLNSFSFNVAISKITALFAVAGFFGVIAGVLWIVIVTKFLKKNKFYMLTIAYLLLLYTVTEYLHGNGAIATLFFGLVLRNSKKLTSMIKGEDNGIAVTSSVEKLFYSQISFFLKAFFFVYIGILLDFSNLKALLFGALIAVMIMLVRKSCSFLTKNLPVFDRKMINSIFARGLAAAVLAQVAVQHNIFNANIIVKMVFAAIMFTIIASSIKIFYINKKYAVVA